LVAEVEIGVAFVEASSRLAGARSPTDPLPFRSQLGKDIGGSHGAKLRATRAVHRDQFHDPSSNIFHTPTVTLDVHSATHIPAT
jgi:hypothetical protein